MKITLETLDRLRVMHDCQDIDETATAVMLPLWKSPFTADGKRPPRFLEYRKYERTGEVHEGGPVFREVLEHT